MTTTYEIRCNGRHSMTTQSVHQMLRRLAALNGAGGPVTVSADGRNLTDVDVEELAREHGGASPEEAEADIAAHPTEKTTLAGGATWQRNTDGGWALVSP